MKKDWSGRSRKCSLHLRLTEREKAYLVAQADRAKVSLQTYFLWLLYNRPIREAPPIEYQEVLKNLREINNSLSQIAVKAQTTNTIETNKYWKNVSDLQKTIGKLMEEIYI